ncbi:MAG: flippase [Clostridiales bacterium]|nr:flippase [Candidatus Equinaster intestinalis]
MQSNIKKNYIYNVSYQIFTLLIPFITTPYVSRVLHPDGIGLYSYSNSIATYFSLAAALGIASYGVREVARVQRDPEKASKLFYELMTVRIVSTIICFSAYSVFVMIFTQEPKYYFAVGLIIVAMLVDCNWFFQAMENFKMLALRNFLIKILSVSLIFLLVKDKDDLIIYFIIQAGSVLVSNLVALPALRKYLVKVDIKTLTFLPHIKNTLVYFVPTIATSVYTVLDKTMIGFITKDMFQNGYYEQAHKIVNMVLTVITSLSTVVGVRTSLLFADEKIDEIKQHIRETFRYVCMIGFPLCLGLIACADTFVPWFFGEGYDDVTPLLKMFAPLVLVISVSNVIGTLYLTPSGQRARSNKAIIAGAVANFILNIFLIPNFGTYGAVIASIFAELLISSLYLIFAKNFIRLRTIFFDGFKYIIMAVIMALPINYIGHIMEPTVLATAIQVVTGVIIYFAGLFILKDSMFFTAVINLKDKLLGHKKGD